MILSDPVLGPPNPWLIAIAKETLGFRRRGLSPLLRLLMPTFSLPIAPLHLTTQLQRNRNALLPHHRSSLRSGVWQMAYGKLQMVIKDNDLLFAICYLRVPNTVRNGSIRVFGDKFEPR